jgi:membrane protein implicated in regulation of membrane protease activity
MDIAIIDWLILIVIVVGLMKLLILNWRETIQFVMVIGLALFALFLGYSLVR